MNILYLDDYINYFNYKINKIIYVKADECLRNGIIEDRSKFIKTFKKLLDKNKIKNSIIKEKILVIINNYYTKEDKILLEEILLELNYSKIIFEYETKYLNIKKGCIYLSYNYTYYYFIYINELGKIEINMYKNNYINKENIINIINSLNFKSIILFGKNILEIINKLNNYNYYYFEDYNNLFIKLILNGKNV